MIQQTQQEEKNKHVVTVEYPVEKKSTIVERKETINDMGKKHHRSGKGAKTAYFPIVLQEKRKQEVVERKELTSKDAFKIVTCASMRIQYLSENYTRDSFREIILNDLYHYVIKRENEKKQK
mgnify:CR=1 FL=1